MKKIIAKAILTSIVLGSLNISTAFASFTDVKTDNKNFTAITYLESTGILEGYSDGSFKPNNEVNRAEFLKIILEGSNIPLDSALATPFKDINNNAWYAPYIRKAYKEGWIEGYNDGNFKPEQTINKVEALKILGEVQNWELPINPENPYKDTLGTEWFIGYLSYAKSHNYLEETGSYFSPEKFMSRAKISEIIYRTLVSPDSQTSQTSETTTTENLDTNVAVETTTTNTAENFSVVDFQEISTDFYKNITLDESIPNIFYKNEIYLIEGTVNSSTATKATVILDDQEANKKNTFTGELTNKHFSIPVHFSTPGNYVLGLIPGESGSSSATTVSVLTSLPESSSTITSTANISNNGMSFSNDHSYINFSSDKNTLKKFTFTQNNNTVTYYNRQNKDSIPINYRDFKNFQEGSVNQSIEVANLESNKPLKISTKFKSTNNKSFTATQHNFSSIENSQISANPPDTLSNNQEISFTGTTKTDIKQNAYVIKPDGFVEDVTLSTNSPTSTYLDRPIINSGGNFSYHYTAKSSGIYIVEINNKNGEPSLNHAIYINTGIPLIPDFFDTLDRTLFEGTLDLNKSRDQLLKLINSSRKEHGLSEVSLSTELNNLAQAHSQDMADNNFFGHVNLAGQTPDDRRIAAGIKTSVGENLASDTSIEAAHFGLLRSASHRSNLLGEDWERVGLGIVNKNGQLFISEEFSIFELSTNQILDMETELFTKINEKRTSNSTTIVSDSNSLKATSKYINDLVINQNAILNNDLFTTALANNNVNGSSELIGRVSGSGNWSTILNSIINDESSILDISWQLIGINIQVDSIGDLHTILILNKS